MKSNSGVYLGTKNALNSDLFEKVKDVSPSAENIEIKTNVDRKSSINTNF